MLKKVLCVFLVFLIVPAFSCAAGMQDAQIRRQIDSMSVREKVGQIIFARPDALDTAQTPDECMNPDIQGVAKVTEEMAKQYEKYPVGGFAIYKKNIRDEKQLAEFTESLHGLGSRRPVLCIDEEGGNIARIANFGSFPVLRTRTMQDIAEKGNVNEAYALGKYIGSYLRQYGFDMTFAPDADVNTNPENIVIGSRAFGSDPVIAGDMASAVLKGLHETGIGGCFKHYPGHGDVATNTYTEYAETGKKWDELLKCEIVPFKKGIEAGTDMIMTAHISAPEITGDDLPATMSPVMLQEKLRKELGFDGVIITDALEMGAIRKYYSPSEAAIRCFNAGADIILDPYDLPTVFDGMVRAAEDGTISKERLDESVYRVLSLKKTIAARQAESSDSK